MGLFEVYYNQFPATIEIHGKKYRYVPEIMIKRSGFFKALHNESALNKSENLQIPSMYNVPMPVDEITKYIKDCHMGVYETNPTVHTLYLYSFMIDSFCDTVIKKFDVSKSTDLDEIFPFIDKNAWSLAKYDQPADGRITIDGYEFSFSIKLMTALCPKLKWNAQYNLTANFNKYVVNDYFSGCDITRLEMLIIAHCFGDIRTAAAAEQMLTKDMGRESKLAIIAIAHINGVPDVMKYAEHLRFRGEVAIHETGDLTY